MKSSWVSPLRCETTTFQPHFLACSIAARVSVNVPIWLGLIMIELMDLAAWAFFISSTLVVVRSSPQIRVFLPIRLFNLVKFLKSFSLKGSSR